MSEAAFNPAALMLGAIAAAEARQANEPTSGKDYTDADGTKNRYNYAGYAAQAGINFLGHVSIEL